ncbi:MAG TPA: class I SAM-dependent methyltransferase [Mycobacteriales bacterium]|nr:class I SAM-dependent methyltransferase [Mycobacteriales bacterium]
MAVDEFHEDGVVPTLNQRGHTSARLNEYSQRFVESLDGVTAPVLDIGAAFGVCTLPALATGATVIACDLEPRHMKRLMAASPDQDRHRLVPIIAEFPTGLRFADHSLGAVHAANLLNYLAGPELVAATEALFSWLRPGGRVFTVSGTPYARNVQEFIPVYEENVRRGAAWPGEARGLRTMCAHPSIQDLPDFLHLLDPNVLTREFERVGFVVEEARMYERAGLPDYLRWDGRENVGFIARKP